MAKATPKKDETKSTAVAAPAKTAVGQALDFSKHAGAGMEGADSESFAIPFLTVIQKTSPQVDEANPEQYIKGAQPAMFFETVSRKTFPGRENGVIFVPCAYRRVFIRWAGRETKGGFKGELTPDAVAQMRADKQIVEFEGKLYAPEKDGSVNPNTSDRFSDTRNHYGILYDPKAGTMTRVLLSLTSTQIKKSKKLMSTLSNLRFEGPSGNYSPPTFACQIRLTTVPESNDQGSWYGLATEYIGPVDNASLFEEAERFNKAVAQGAVQPADYNAVNGVSEPKGEAADGF